MPTLSWVAEIKTHSCGSVGRECGRGFCRSRGPASSAPCARCGPGARAWTPRAARAMMPRTMDDKRQAAPTLPPDRVLTFVRVALALAVLLFIPGLLEQYE